MHHQGCFLNEAPAFFSSCKCCMFLQILARIANTRRIEQVHLTWVTSNARLITIHTCFLLSHFVVSYSTAFVWSMSMRHTAYLVSLFNFWLTTKVGPFHVAAGRGVSQRDIAGIGLEINIVEGVFACRVVLFFFPTDSSMHMPQMYLHVKCHQPSPCQRSSRLSTWGFQNTGL